MSENSGMGKQERALWEEIARLRAEESKTLCAQVESLTVSNIKLEIERDAALARERESARRLARLKEVEAERDAALAREKALRKAITEAIALADIAWDFVDARSVIQGEDREVLLSMVTVPGLKDALATTAEPEGD